LLCGVVISLALGQPAFASSLELQGQDKGNTNTWTSQNLQNWQELDYVPCRVYASGMTPGSSQTVTIYFPHFDHTTPGFQNLTSFTPSANVSIIAGPTLFAPTTSGTWSYTLTFQMKDANPGYVRFLSRLAAGAHLNTGSSLMLQGDPTSMGTLQIHKPAPGPGLPDLAITKTGPASVRPGERITYTLAYTNKAPAGTTTAVGAQISDMLPPELTVLPGDVANGGDLVGNSIFWDLGNLAHGTNGVVSFQALVNTNVPFSHSFTNFSQVLSAEDDVNYADNTSTFVSTTISCTVPFVAISPASVSKCTGESVTFITVVSGTGPLTYKWFKNATLLSVTNNSLTLPSLTAADAATYKVVLTGLCGSATNTATLSVSAAPAISCSTNKTVEAGSSWTFDPPTANYPVTIVSTVTNPVGQCAFQATRTWQTTDPCGSALQCAQTVSVVDKTAPHITCPANLSLTADAGHCSRSNVTFSVPATDNCAVASVVSVPPSGSTFPVGVTTVTNTATDTYGNKSVCTFTVTITDTQGPVMSCSTNLNLTADAGHCSRSNVTFSVTANDNCDGAVPVVSTPRSGSTFLVGDTTVTNTATDSHGNTSVCTFTVTITDTQAPVITCSSNLNLSANTGQCSRSNVTFNVTANDNCDGPVAVVSVPASGSTFPVGVTVVTNTATDSHDNTSICTFTVTINDTQAPVITCSSNLSLIADAGHCSRSNVTFSVTANDNCDGPVPVVSVPASGSTFPVGVTTVTNTATDSHGNSSICTFTVTITDTQAPVLTCSSNLNLNADAGHCSRSNVTFNVTANDNCDGPVTVVSVPASGSTFPVGVTTVTNTASDSHGNTSVCAFTVTIADTQAPVINCSSNLNLIADAGHCSRSNVTFSVTASDNCDGPVPVVSVPPSGSIFPVGVTVVTNTARDSHGNTSVCTFTVTINDTQPPVIACSSNLNLTADAGHCSRSNVTFSVTANDNCDGPVPVVSVPPSGSTFPVGVTSVTNTATDSHGNTSVCTFSITIADTQAPVINCSSNLSLIADAGHCSRSNVTFNVTANDNCDGPVPVISVPPSGSLFPVGVTVVTNTARDSHGNTSACTFTVTITDTQAPVISCSSNLNLTADAGHCSRSNVTFSVTATDNCDGPVPVVSVPASGSTFPVGLTVVTNTARDSHGNTSTCIFSVTITDTQAPVITCPTNLNLQADAGQCSHSNVTFHPTALDNCDGPVTVVSVPPSGSTFPAGVTVVTNTATDSHGNTSTCTFTVTITDNEPPVFSCWTNLNLVADAGQCSRSNVTFHPTATDNCDGPVTVTSVPPSGTTFPVGVNLVSNTATDSHGNTSTCYFTVTVADTQPPVFSCGTNINLSADPGLCTRSNVTFHPTAMDNCDGPVTVVSQPPSGSTFPVGVTVVTNTATDSHGNQAVCTFTVTINATFPSVFASGPANQSACPGDTVVFSTVASGSGPFSYQWYKAGATLPGQTSNNLSLPNVSTTDASTYTVIVTGQCGAATNSAVLTLLDTLAVTGPVSQTVCPGNTVVFSTAASGTGPYAYQWLKNGGALSGQTASSLTLTSVSSTDAATYSVIVMGRCGSITNSATLSLHASTTATPLANGIVIKNLGASVTFATTAAGTGPFTYVWTKNGAVIPGSTLSSLSLTHLDYTNAGVYAVQLTGLCNTATQSATLEINVPPTVSIISPTNGTFFFAPASFPVIADARSDTNRASAITNVEFFLFTTNKLGQTNQAPYFVNLTNLAAGTYTFSARATDDLGATGISANVTVTVLQSAPLTIISAMRFNPQNGLFEETVRVTNPTLSTNLVRVYVSGLPTNMIVYNASGTNSAGTPYVQSLPVLPQSSVDMVIEIYVRNSSATPNPTLNAELVPATSGGGGVTFVGTPQHINRGVMLPNKSFLVEFATVANRVYYVQYSSDLKTWLTAQPSINGSGTYIQWIDNGQPKTQSAPATTPQRFYRVISVP
jgi:uncharacterized repeat protein (TIGR01451 family)